MEESFRQRARHHRYDIRRAGGMSENHDVTRVATELRNVALDPLQRGDLVEQRVIARRMVLGLFRQLGVCHEAEHVHPVIQTDEDDALLREVRTVVLVFRRRASCVPATVDPHHHRQPIASRLCWCPDVEV